MATLSKASVYEQTFRTRHRTPGRPTDVEDTEPMFSAPEVDPVIVRVATRRAYAVLHNSYKDELRSLFAKELAVLRRRGVETVAADAGIRLKVEVE